MNKILTAALVVLVAGGVAWKLYPHADATPSTAAPSPSHHVTQFASPEERTQLAQRIAAAAQTRLEASLPQTTAYTSTPAPQLPPLPPPPVIAASDLDKDTIRRAMREVVPFILQCFETAMPTLPTDELSIRAHLTITGDRDVGAIIDAKQLFDADQKPLPPKFDDCLRSTLQTLELPPLGDGSSVEIEYPFTFRKAVPDGSGSDDGDDGGDGDDDD